MLLQGISADTDLPAHEFLYLELEKKRITYLMEGNFNVLNYVVYCKSYLRLTRHRINKKVTCSQCLIKFQQQK